MPGEISVSELNRLAASCLSASPLLNDLLVEGEISSPKKYPSGHFYFTLKDKNASVSCVMFKSDVLAHRELPGEGDHVLCRGKASIYERDGRFQFYARQFKPVGVGRLWQQFEALKKELQNKGYFDTAHKKSLPYIPKCIGVVTSEAGAVLRDIIHVLRRRFPGFHLRLISTRVQGSEAAAEIAAAIDLFNVLKAADVLIVGRGGGSMEDLWCFNDPLVAEAVYRSHIPIISAVGHETDFSICDFTADLRAPTPSAAAELAVPVKAELLQRLVKLEQTLRESSFRRLTLERQRLRTLTDQLHFTTAKRLREASLRLDSLLQRPVLVSPKEMTTLRRHELEGWTYRLYPAVKHILTEGRYRSSALRDKLELLNPWTILNRGYAAVTDSEGHITSSVRSLQEGMTVGLCFRDGSAEAVIKRIDEICPPQADLSKRSAADKL